MNLGRLRRAVKPVAIGGLLVFAGLQLVPYGWRHSNPPVISNPPWPSEEAERLARVACYSCHSNETDWPPYSYVAPMSWLVRRDVDQGRAELNFSNWSEYSGEADDAAESILDGEMPPGRYTRIHPDADLSTEEKRTLVAALTVLDERDD